MPVCWYKDSCGGCDAEIEPWRRQASWGKFVGTYWVENGWETVCQLKTLFLIWKMKLKTLSGELCNILRLCTVLLHEVMTGDVSGMCRRGAEENYLSMLLHDAYDFSEMFKMTWACSICILTWQILHSVHAVGICGERCRSIVGTRYSCQWCFIKCSNDSQNGVTSRIPEAEALNSSTYSKNSYSFQRFVAEIYCIHSMPFSKK